MYIHTHPSRKRNERKVMISRGIYTHTTRRREKARNPIIQQNWWKEAVVIPANVRHHDKEIMLSCTRVGSGVRCSQMVQHYWGTCKMISRQFPFRPLLERMQDAVLHNLLRRIRLLSPGWVGMVAAACGAGEGLPWRTPCCCVFTSTGVMRSRDIRMGGGISRRDTHHRISQLGLNCRARRWCEASSGVTVFTVLVKFQNQNPCTAFRALRIAFESQVIWTHFFHFSSMVAHAKQKNAGKATCFSNKEKVIAHKPHRRLKAWQRIAAWNRGQLSRDDL